MQQLIENALADLQASQSVEAQHNSVDAFKHFDNVGWPPSC